MNYLLNKTASIVLVAIAIIGGVSLKDLVWAESLVTQNESEVTAFQCGTNILGFDELPGNGGGGRSGGSGVSVLPESQVKDQFQVLGVRFSSEGKSVGVVSVEGLSNQSDAKSPFNLIGGTVLDDPLPKLNYFAPIELSFVTPNTVEPNVTSCVGAWNDPTGSRIRLSVFDLNGKLLETAEADEGFFIGISNPSIASARFEFVESQSVRGFSLDDIMFVSPKTTKIDAAGVGRRIILENSVLFDFGESRLKPSATRVLSDIVEELKIHDIKKIIIEGHTDSNGSEAYNLQLSQRRAEAVAAWLVNNAGISGELLISKGYGESQPVADNQKPNGEDNPEGRAKNRRVEIIIP